MITFGETLNDCMKNVSSSKDLPLIEVKRTMMFKKYDIIAPRSSIAIKCSGTELSPAQNPNKLENTSFA